MTKRIFRSIFLVALVVLLLSVALLSVVFYNDYAVQYRSELKSEALSMAHAINGGLAEEDYLRSLEQDKISPIRITWIGADGTVRYDNEAAPAQMENHAARTEVADALRYGAGESERYSATLSQKTFYYACRLQDGTVLRLAGTRDSVLGILLRMLRPAVAAVLVAIALAWLLSYRLSKRIVRPLNALDLEHPEQAEAYDELSPLLEKISAQNRQIAAQMDELRRRQTEFTAITEHMNEGLLIERGAERLGISILETHLQDASQPVPAWRSAMDVVLADVPCSGLGVIRKKPDIRYHEPSAELPALQRAILAQQAEYVRPGGVLLYSTCTILRRENEAVAEDFLRTHPDFVPENAPWPEGSGIAPGAMVTLLPGQHETDGFFICKFRRKP